MAHNYVYRITHLPTNTHYIGSRKSRMPIVEDLGVSYFTSSKRFRPIFQNTPRSKFKVKIVSEHDTYDAALQKEQQYIIRVGAVTNNQFYNQAYFDAKLVLSAAAEEKRQTARLRLACDPVWIERNRQSHKGQVVTEKERQDRRLRMLGTHLSIEARQKQSAALRGKPKSPEHRQMLREAKLRYHAMKRASSPDALTRQDAV